ncbi:MAG: hypothetical protein ACXACW_16020 [Candidatus Hodarchaeales archaeon]|jgi:hypothetical protein
MMILFRKIRGAVKNRKWLSVVGILEDYTIIKFELPYEARTVSWKAEWRYYVRVVISYSVKGVQYTKTVNDKSYTYDYREGAERFIFKKYINRDIKVSYNPKRSRRIVNRVDTMFLSLIGDYTSSLRQKSNITVILRHPILDKRY